MSNKDMSLSELSAFLNNNESSDGNRLAEFLQKKTNKKKECGGRIFGGEFNPELFNLNNVRLEKLSLNKSNSEEQLNVETAPVEKESDPKEQVQPQTDIISSISKKAQDPGSPASNRPVADLRRFSLRRELLKNFDSIVESPNFSPRICSTPLTIKKTDKVTEKSNQGELLANVLPQSTFVEAEEIGKYAQEKTPVEKDLASEKDNRNNSKTPSNHESLNRDVTEKILPPANQQKTPIERASSLQNGDLCSSPQKSCQSSSQAQNITDKDEKLETQSESHGTLKIIINQTFNASEKSIAPNATFVKPPDKTKESSFLVISRENQTYVSNKSKTNQIVDVEVNSSLTPECLYKNTDNLECQPGIVPLNLVTAETPLNKIHEFPKLDSTKHQTQAVKSPVLNDDIDKNMALPKAHQSTIRRDRAKYGRSILTLNKAPSTPINGEKFASEIKRHLARLENHEILDLRIRNSLGKVFPVCGRRSTAKTQTYRQQKLDEEIQLEIDKRSNTFEKVQGSTDPELTKACIGNDILTESNMLLEVFDVPSAFKNNTNDQLAEISTHRVANTSIKLPGSESSRNKTKTNKKKQKLDEEIQLEIDKRSNTFEKVQGSKDPELTKACIENDILTESNMLLEVFDVPSAFKNNTNDQLAETTTHKVADTSIKLPGSESSRNKTKTSITLQSNDTLNQKPSSEQAAHSINICDLPKVTEKSRNSNTSRRTRILYSKGASLNEEDIMIYNDDHEEIIPPVLSSPPPVYETENLELLIVPPPPQYSKTKNVETSVVSFPLNEVQNILTDDKSRQIGITSQNAPECVFKKPLPVNKPRGRKKKILSKNESMSTETTTTATDQTNSSVDVLSIRKSGRGHVPRKNNLYSNTPINIPIPTFQRMYQQIMGAGSLPMASNNENITQNSTRRKTKKQLTNNSSKKSRVNTPSSISTTLKLPAIPIEPVLETAKQPSEEKQKQKSTKTNEEAIADSTANKTRFNNGKASRFGHISIKPPPIIHLNNLFDKLKNTQSAQGTSSSDESRKKNKKLKVNLKRLNPRKKNQSEAQEKNDQEYSIPTSGKELISWLMDLPSRQTTGGNESIFNDIHYSTAGEITFMDLDGIDYAFYRTKTNGNFGYLRFKPNQVKLKKKAKNFDLHFVVMHGRFKICTGKDEGYFEIGDMVVIEKGVYYSIENITTEIGLLMIIKK